MEHLDMLLNECMEDFPEDDKSAIAEQAAKIARANITEQTRAGHTRCVKPGRDPSSFLRQHSQNNQGIHFLPFEEES